MKISIALCTRNGEKFLRTQLSSFLDQTLPADEIVVCDEGSTDQTLKILEQYQDRLPLRIHVNEQRLGTLRNFEKAFALCTGDLIFPADQDDFWENQKLERMAAYFQQHPEAQVLFSDAKLVNEFGVVQKKARLWESFRFRKKLQKKWQSGQALEILLDGNRVTGCTMGVRRAFMRQALPFPSHLDGYVLHDYWLGLLAALNQEIDFLPASYIQYRIHSQQQVGLGQVQGKVPTLWERMARPHREKVEPYQKKLKLLIQIKKAIEEKRGEQVYEPLAARLEFVATRANLQEHRWKRLPKVMKCFIKGYYHRFKDVDGSNMDPYLMLMGDLIE